MGGKKGSARRLIPEISGGILRDGVFPDIPSLLGYFYIIFLSSKWSLSDFSHTYFYYD